MRRQPHAGLGPGTGTPELSLCPCRHACGSEQCLCARKNRCFRQYVWLSLLCAYLSMAVLSLSLCLSHAFKQGTHANGVLIQGVSGFAAIRASLSPTLILDHQFVPQAQTGRFPVGPSRGISCLYMHKTVFIQMITYHKHRSAFLPHLLHLGDCFLSELISSFLIFALLKECPWRLS